MSDDAGSPGGDPKHADATTPSRGPSRVTDDRAHRPFPRAKALIIASGLLMATLVVGWVWWSLSSSRAAALNAESRELQNVALALSEDIDRAFERAEVIQDSVIERLKSAATLASPDPRRNWTSVETNAFLKAKISDMPQIDAVTIIDSHGDLLNFSRAWPIPKINIADRDYFKNCVADAACDKFVSNVVQNRGSGTWNFYIGKKVTNENGAFLGFVLMAMNVEYFEKSFESFAMTAGRVSLFRMNGKPLARYPHIESEYSKSYISLPMFGAKARRLDTVQITSIGDNTQTQRLIGFSKSGHYPIMTSVSVGLDAVLAGWRRSVDVQIAFATLMFILIGATVMSLLRSIDSSRNEIAAQRAIATHARQFETAINNVVIGVAMFDADDKLIVSNERFAQIHGLPLDGLRPGLARLDIPGEKSAPEGLAANGGDAIRELSDGRLICVRSHRLEGGGLVLTHEDVTERKRAEAALAHLVYHDSLTGLSNRARLEQRLDEAVARLARGTCFALHYIDLDRFKDVNDGLGHAAGDRLLIEVAERLRQCAGPLDTVARIGGDEFIVLRAGADEADAAEFADRALRSLARPYDIRDNKIEIGASIGIALAPEDGADAATLSRKADVALYRAKGEGKGGHRFFEPEMDEEFLARRQLELDLRQALENEQLELHYQPIVDASTRRILAFEALLRWRHPERGFIPPLDFIPLAEASGLIVRIGEWVLRKACSEAARWPRDISVSVNVSSAQFKAGSLVETVAASLLAAALPASRLKIEITESIVLDASDANFEILHALNDLGVRIMLDDFGSGYSSLSYLRHFPFDTVKIDKSFVQSLEEKSALAILKTVAELAATLGMRTIAEGVETEAQARQVAELGCAELQGYWLGRPMPAREALAMLQGPEDVRLSA